MSRCQRTVISALAFGLSLALSSSGYTATTVENGRTALESLISWHYDLIILDLMLPFVDGFQVLREISQDQHRPPVIVISALGDTPSKVNAFKLGATDYVTKPFGVAELLERIRLRLNGARGTSQAGGLLRVRHLVIDSQKREVHSAGKRVHLTRMEFALLMALVENRNRVISKEELLQKVWGYQADIKTRTLEFHIAQLRSKLETRSRKARPDPNTMEKRVHAGL